MTTILPMSATEAKSFPRCETEGPNIDSSAFIEPKTGLAVTLGSLVLVLFILISILTVYIGIVLLIGLIVDYFQRQKALAQLKGSSIEINERQFPEIHACAQIVAQRLGLSGTPVIYIVEGNTINAAAVRLAGRRVVVLTDDIVHACLCSGEPRTLSFILGHELAHHSLGHTGYFRSQLSRMMKWLSRLDELSCDAVANQIVGNPSISAKALTVMLAGPHLLPYLNTDQLIEQARQVAGDKTSKKAEKYLTHPLMLRRIHRLVS